MLDGCGITPGYALIPRILGEKDDTTQLRVVDANKTENDILVLDGTGDAKDWIGKS